MPGILDILDGQIYVISGRRFKLTYRNSDALATFHAALAMDQASLNNSLGTFPVNRHPHDFSTESHLDARAPNVFPQTVYDKSKRSRNARYVLCVRYT